MLITKESQQRQWFARFTKCEFEKKYLLKSSE